MPPEILPHGDGEGGVGWRPVGKVKSATTDVASLGEVADFVADLFPVLRDFSQIKLPQFCF